MAGIADPVPYGRITHQVLSSGSDNAATFWAALTLQSALQPHQRHSFAEALDKSKPSNKRCNCALSESRLPRPHP